MTNKILPLDELLNDLALHTKLAIELFVVCSIIDNIPDNIIDKE